jgi:hypothetical protein
LEPPDGDCVVNTTSDENLFFVDVATSLDTGTFKFRTVPDLFGYFRTVRIRLEQSIVVILVYDIVGTAAPAPAAVVVALAGVMQLKELLVASDP